MALWTVSEEDLGAVLSGLHGEAASRDLLEIGADTWGAAAESNGHPRLREPRPSQSVKLCLLPPRQRVATYGGLPSEPGLAVSSVAGAASGEAESGEGLRVLLGARACESRALEYLDRVFLSPPGPDSHYEARRRRHLVVTVDCVSPSETCFCTLVGGRPYATEGFDLNLTPLAGGYLLEAGTEWGEALIAEAGSLALPATEQDLRQRESLRQEALERLESQNEAYRPLRDPAEALAAAEDAERWDGLSRGCVECGACTQICPTCHCFFLRDRALASPAADAVSPATDAAAAYARLRGWDSCMWAGYSRMAGPAGGKPNPRARFRPRFANRFLHKYAWSPQQWGMSGCVGCGRCTDACAAGIDIRQVIREMTA